MNTYYYFYYCYAYTDTFSIAVINSIFCGDVDCGYIINVLVDAYNKQ